MHRTTRLVGALLATGLLLTACTSTDTADDATETPMPVEPDGGNGASTDAAGDTLEVTGVDYGFEGLDGPVAAGTTLTFTNASDAEYHEMVVMKLADDETRTVDELLELPEEEAMQAMQFLGVTSAAPGASSTEPIDGSLTLDEAGRYVLVCFIPVGADPAAVEEAFSGQPTEPPDLGDGPPHAFEGMVTEIEVS